ncbi:hypothetical protein ACWDZ8_44905, partial [Streptomyces sp. NPDC003233]
MDSRLNYYGNSLATKVLKHLYSASKVLSDSTLPATVQRDDAGADGQAHLLEGGHERAHARVELGPRHDR